MSYLTQIFFQEIPGPPYVRMSAKDSLAHRIYESYLYGPRLKRQVFILVKVSRRRNAKNWSNRFRPNKKTIPNNDFYFTSGNLPELNRRIYIQRTYNRSNVSPEKIQTYVVIGSR